MGTPPAQDPEFDDPLAELARLVGQDDPFRNIFRNNAAPKEGGRVANDPRRVAEHHAEPEPDPYAQRRAFHAPDAAEPERSQEPAQDFGDETGHDFEPHGFGPLDFGFRATAHDDPVPHDHHVPGHQAGQEPSYDHAADGDPRRMRAYDRDDIIADPYGHESTPEDEARDASDFRPSPLTPDIWAQGGEVSPPIQPEESRPAEGAKTPRRPFVVLAAVLILTGGGLAATFLARTASGPVMNGKTAPIILAAAGPNKVKLADNSAGATAPEDADAALLNKNAGTNPAPAKIVNSQERPIDLAQLPKSAAPADPNAAQNNAFPQPKKVKTFLVRADGSMISDASNPMPAPAGMASPPALTPPVPAPIPAPALPSLAAGTVPEPVVAPTPRPATPKTTTRAATTPKAAPKSIADALNNDGTQAKARQPASPGVRSATKAKPVEVVDAGNATDATLGAGGSYGVQLAASPSEQDARDAFARLKKQYPDQLSALKATVRKAETGDKSVYRVRVGNLSQDEAKTLCTKLQASGGSCYVVH